MPKILGSKPRLAVAQIVAMLSLAGCGGIQSMLEPQGPVARSISNISWVMVIGAAIITLIVMALALYAVYRDPGQRAAVPEYTMILVGGVAWPVLTLTALLVYGVIQMGDLRAEQAGAGLQIEVVGNQWWWDVHYLDADGKTDFVTSNEIRIPAGEPVAVRLRSNDVIHSFWVPNLAGKIDLVPGRTNQTRIEADRPGEFRGQCAEFCGAQHARMGLLVIAEPRAQHDAWRAAQRQPATPPANQRALTGREAFSRHCVECHTVRGVGTARQRGPDLTHVGSRRFLGGGTLANSPANLQRFIAHSQSIKPGSRMPEFAHLEQPTLDALVSFLEGLR